MIVDLLRCLLLHIIAALVSVLCCLLHMTSLLPACGLVQRQFTVYKEFRVRGKTCLLSQTQVAATTLTQNAILSSSLPDTRACTKCRRIFMQGGSLCEAFGRIPRYAWTYKLRYLPRRTSNKPICPPRSMDDSLKGPERQAAHLRPCDSGDARRCTHMIPYLFGATLCCMTFAT